MELEITFAIPGNIEKKTGGYLYDKCLLKLFPQHGITAHHLILPDSFPDPSPFDIEATRHLLSGLPPERRLLIDGLAFSSFPSQLYKAISNPIVALVHHPVSYESGLSSHRQRSAFECEKAAFAHARHLIVTSVATADILARTFGVSRNRITVAMPGVDMAARAEGSGHSRISILAVGAVMRRKAYDVLLEALSQLKHLDFHLRIVGSTDHDPGYFQELQQLTRRFGLGEFVTFAGMLSEEKLNLAYHASDLFVLASLYEGYGMVLGEAMVRGLPIVATRTGAADDTIPDTAALKVEPGNILLLRESLRMAIEDHQLRTYLAAGSYSAGKNLQGWDCTARIAAHCLKKLYPAAIGNENVI